MSALRDKLVRGVAWTTAANWGSQLLSFAVYTGLARLLTPRAFGLVSIAGVYIALVQLFVVQGFGTAIIQREDLEDEHLNSAFWIAVATATTFCVISIVFAGYVARIFHEPDVIPVIRWLSLSFILYALSAVPTAILNRKLHFRALAVRGFIGTTLGGAVGLSMALSRWGVWSLVGQQLTNAFVGCVCLWLAVDWHPSWKISKKHLKDLYHFSVGLMGNDILWFFSQKSDQTIVGHEGGAIALGPYAIASRLITLLHDASAGPMQSVILPAFSRLQTNPDKLAISLYRYCEVTSFVLLPCFAGVSATAPVLVPALFGAKWMASVSILQILAYYGAMRVILNFSHPFLLAKGRVGLYLLMNILLASLTLLACLAASHDGPVGVAWAMVASMMLFAIVFLVIAQYQLDVHAPAIVKAFTGPILLSIAMHGVVAELHKQLLYHLRPALSLPLLILAGVITYLLLARLTKPRLLKEVWQMLAQLGNKANQDLSVMA